MFKRKFSAASAASTAPAERFAAATAKRDRICQRLKENETQAGLRARAPGRRGGASMIFDICQ